MKFRGCRFVGSCMCYGNSSDHLSLWSNAKKNPPKNRLMVENSDLYVYKIVMLESSSHGPQLHCSRSQIKLRSLQTPDNSFKPDLSYIDCQHSTELHHVDCRFSMWSSAYCAWFPSRGFRFRLRGHFLLCRQLLRRRRQHSMPGGQPMVSESKMLRLVPDIDV